MLSNEDQGHIRRVKQVAYKLNLPEEVIEQAIHLTSEYIKNKIGSIEIDSPVLLTKEEFESRLPIIKLPAMGYLKPDYYKYIHVYKKTKEKQERLRIQKEIALKNKEEELIKLKKEQELKEQLKQQEQNKENNNK